MRWLQGTWAMRFNRFRTEHGHLFQGRYRAQHVERGHSMAQVAHYIHLNPVRAGIVGPDQLRAFRWSSIHHFLSKGRPEWLEAAIVLRESGELPDTAKGWAYYLDYLAAVNEESPQKKKERFGQLRRGWCVGSKDFKRGLLDELKEHGASLEDGRLADVESDRWQEVREGEWRERLRRAAEALKVDLKKLPARKSAPEKVMLASLLKQTTGVSNGWLATELRMGRPASVSQFVRRFRLSGGVESARFRQLLSIVKH